MSGAIPPLPLLLHSVNTDNFTFYIFKKEYWADQLKMAKTDGACEMFVEEEICIECFASDN
jgi:hypothetical protein